MRLFKRFKLPQLGSILQGDTGELWVVVERNCLKDCFYIKSIRTGSIFHQPGYFYPNFIEKSRDISRFMYLVEAHGWKDDEGKWI